MGTTRRNNSSAPYHLDEMQDADLARLQRPDRVEGVAGSLPTQFERLDLEGRLIGQGQLEHRHPVPAAGQHRSGLVRWTCGGHEEHALEAEGPLGRPRDVQVPQVHGIEGTAVEADPRPCGGLRPTLLDGRAGFPKARCVALDPLRST